MDKAGPEDAAMASFSAAAPPAARLKAPRERLPPTAASPSDLDPQLVRRFRNYAIGAAATAILIAGASLVGTFGGAPWLASYNPVWITMKVNTAIGLILVGIGSLLLTASGDDRPARRWVTWAAAGIVFFVGLATLFQDILGLDFGIDQLFFVEPPGAVGTIFPGRMAPVSAISFMFFGLTLLARILGYRLLAMVTNLPILLTSFFAVIAYVLGAYEINTLAGRVTAISAPAAIAFLLLSSGMLVIDPQRGTLRLLASPQPGGVMVRRLLPLALSLPVLVAWLRLHGESQGWFATAHFGSAAVALANVVFLSWATLLSAAHLNRSDAARIDAVRVAARARYARSLIEASLDPLVTISADGKITDVNEATVRATGVSREKMIGSDFASYFTDPGKAEQGYREVFTKGFVTNYALAIRRTSGTIMDVTYNASLYHDEAGNVVGVFAAARDITEQKRAEKELEGYRKHLEDLVAERTSELRSSQSLLKAITDNTPDHIMVQDSNQRYTFVINPQLGLSREDMIGKTDRDIISGEEGEKLAAIKTDVLTSGKQVRVGIPLTDKAGERHYFDGTYVPMHGEDGAITGLIGYFRDVTDRQRSEDRIAALNRDLQVRAAALESANKELETFSYSVSHDLRTPLRAIDGFSNILLQDYAGKLDEEGKRLLNVVRDSTVKMSRLIDDILSFSRISRTEISRGSVDMEALVNGVLTGPLAPALAGRELAVTVGTLPPIQGDPGMLERVWTNLLDNAIKFTAPKPEARIEVGATTGEGEIVYFVRDTGVGFDMQYAEKLFGVFQRLHGVEFKGTGIGLAIVKRVVERHGGRVWAEGKPDEGATFYFALPIKEHGDEQSKQ